MLKIRENKSVNFAKKECENFPNKKQKESVTEPDDPAFEDTAHCRAALHRSVEQLFTDL